MVSIWKKKLLSFSLQFPRHRLASVANKSKSPKIRRSSHVISCVRQPVASGVLSAPFQFGGGARRGGSDVTITHTLSSLSVDDESSDRDSMKPRGNSAAADATLAGSTSFHSEAAELVDALLERTSGMVDPRAANVVAFSGGVDSSLVAALVYRVFETHRCDDGDGDGKGGSVRAILGLSPAVPHSQIEMARTVSRTVGIPLAEVPTTEGKDEAYVQNNGHACYVCKTHLYSTLEAIAASIHEEEEKRQLSKRKQHLFERKDEPYLGKRQRVILYNGTNSDDIQDPTRLGLVAASDYAVHSPLALISKSQVRLAARHLGLPNWNAAASPCLRSRLALGVPATKEHLRAVEHAEIMVRRVLDLDETRDVRVRLLAGGRAVVEVDELVLKSQSNYNRARASSSSWVEEVLRKEGFERKCKSEWGFKSFGGVRTFKTGSVAAKPISDVFPRVQLNMNGDFSTVEGELDLKGESEAMDA